MAATQTSKPQTGSRPLNNTIRSRRLIVPEGPAGSGKSFWRNAILNVVGIPTYKNSDRFPKRGLTSQSDSVRHSELYDFDRALQYWESSCDLLLDRFFWSQWVYSHIRDVDYFAPLNLAEAAEDWLKAVGKLHGQRLGTTYRGLVNDGEVSMPHVHWVILVPSTNQIEINRNSAADRFYPYSATIERNLYLQACDNAQKSQKLNKNYTIHKVTAPRMTAQDIKNWYLKNIGR